MSRRKKKKKGLVFALIEIIISIVLLLAILGVLSFFFCELEKVTVEGTDLYTSEEITGYILDDKYSSNTIYAFLKNFFFPKGDAEFIDSFDVKLTGLNSLKIVCNEKTILGYISAEDGNYIYFDYDGIVTEISETYVDRGYMKVEGVTCDEQEVGAALSIGTEEIGYLTSLIKILQKNDLMPNVISYDENNHITLSYDTYNIAIGSSVYLEEKIDRVLKILPQIDGMYGTLHVENYSTSNTDIVFEKDTETEE